MNEKTIDRSARALAAAAQVGALALLLAVLTDTGRPATLAPFLVILLMVRALSGALHGWSWRQRHPWPNRARAARQFSPTL